MVPQAFGQTKDQKALEAKKTSLEKRDQRHEPLTFSEEERTGRSLRRSRDRQ